MGPGLIAGPYLGKKWDKGGSVPALQKASA